MTKPPPLPPPLPARAKPKIPIWIWVLAGSGTLVFVAMMAGLGWFFTNSHELFAPAFSQSNPDFELLRYYPQSRKIDVRHKPSGKVFRRLDMPPGFGPLRKVDLATQPRPVPDWARYPGAKLQDGNWVAEVSPKELSEFYSDRFFEHLLVTERESGSLIEACHPKTFVCAVVALVSKPENEKSTTFRVLFSSAP